jgi:SP family arabinose:H+ symporter-like MFS transporter
MSEASDPTGSKSAGFLALICIVAALGGFLFGFDTAVVSGTLDHLVPQFQLSPAMTGITVAAALFGCIGGAAIAGTLSDAFGRKPILLLAALLFLLSAIGSALPQQVATLLAARFIGGVGVGMASMLSPMYLSEMSPPHRRGLMVALYQLAITIGILLAYFSNAMLVNQLNPANFEHGSFWHWLLIDEVWRGMFAMETLPAAGFFLLLLLVPESPRWLAKHERHHEAQTILTRLVGSDQARSEMQAIRTALAEEGGSLRELLKPGLRIALVIGIALPFFSQASGINAVMYYGPDMLSSAGWKINESLGGQVLVGFVNMIFTFVAILCVDRFGRKPLLYTGVFGVLFTLIGAGLLLVTGQTGWPFLLSLILFVACFAFSLGPVTWIVVSELFPTRIRGRAMSVATMTIWIANTALMFLVPIIGDTLGLAWTFWLFALLVAPCLLLTWKLVPETKGKTLEQIERSWHAAESNERSTMPGAAAASKQI